LWCAVSSKIPCCFKTGQSGDLQREMEARPVPRMNQLQLAATGFAVAPRHNQISLSSIFFGKEQAGSDIDLGYTKKLIYPNPSKTKGFVIRISPMHNLLMY
jgi:hypothetical protein